MNMNEKCQHLSGTGHTSHAACLVDHSISAPNLTVDRSTRDFRRLSSIAPCRRHNRGWRKGQAHRQLGHRSVGQFGCSAFQANGALIESTPAPASEYPLAWAIDPFHLGFDLLPSGPHLGRATHQNGISDGHADSDLNPSAVWA